VVSIAMDGFGECGIDFYLHRAVGAYFQFLF
jgi:hypothetical protein